MFFFENFEKKPFFSAVKKVASLFLQNLSASNFFVEISNFLSNFVEGMRKNSKNCHVWKICDYLLFWARLIMCIAILL